MLAKPIVQHPLQKKILAMANENYAKTAIKVFYCSVILLRFSDVWKILSAALKSNSF